MSCFNFVLPRRAILLCAMVLVSSFGIAKEISAQARGEVRQVVNSCSSGCSIKASGNETVEVLLPDATSIILASGAEASITRGADGRISVVVSNGLVRVAGGSSNIRNAIEIVTPSAVLSLLNGAAFVAVAEGSTRTHLLNGKELLVASQGRTRRLYRPGFQVVAKGGAPSSPRRMSAKAVTNDILSLSSGLISGVIPRVTSDGAGSAGNRTGGQGRIVKVKTPTGETPLPYELAIALDSEVDPTDRTPIESTTTELATSDFTPFNPTPTEPMPTDPTPTAVSFSNDIGSLNLADSFDETVGGRTNNVGQTTTSTNFASTYSEIQDYPFSRGGTLGTIASGPVTNRIVDGVSLIDHSWTQENVPESFESISLRFEEIGAPFQVWFDASRFAGYDTWGYTDPAQQAGGGIKGSFFFGRDYVDKLGESVFESFSVRMQYGPGTFSGPIESLSARTGLSEAISLTGVHVPPYDMYDISDLERDGAIAISIVSGAGFQARTPDNFLLSEITPAYAIQFGYGSCPVDVCPLGGADQDDVDIDQINSRYKNFTHNIANGRKYKFGGIEYYGTSTSNSGPAAVIEDPDPTYRLVFASGDLDALYQQPDTAPDNRKVGSGFSVDRFHLAGSMQGALKSGIDNGFVGMDHTTGRAFLRSESWTGLDAAGSLSLGQLTDSGVILAYPDTPVIGDGANPAVLLHADFGLADTAAGQVSSMSVTVGTLTYRLHQASESVDGILNTHTVGSARGVNSASVIFQSTSQSSAAGGGNSLLAQDSGRLGFFVLENSGNLYDDIIGGNIGDHTTLNGGTETQLDGISANYAALRIGVGYAGDENPATNRGAFTDTTVGYATGFVEKYSGAQPTLSRFRMPYDGVSELGPTIVPANLAFSASDPVTNSFGVTMTVNGTDVMFPTTAFISEREYGALTHSVEGGSDPVYNLALISGEIGAGAGDGTNISQELSGQFSTSGPSPVQITTISAGPSNHTKWGFFMGDITTDDDRSHIHAGTFAAGDRINMAGKTIAPVTALYQGQALGNVTVDGGGAKLVVGSFQETFNFANDTGHFKMDFDQNQYEGATQSFNAGSGGLLYAGQSNASASGYNATVSGEFVSSGGALVPVDGGAVPGGLIGGFDIAGPDNYNATGSIAANFNGVVSSSD